MRSFDEMRWTPAGARPHVLIAGGHETQLMAEAYLACARRWWAEQADSRAFEEVFQPVPPEFQHVTLGWADRVIADISAEVMAQLQAELGRRLGEVAPVRLRVGPAVVGRYAIELYVQPDDHASDLAGVVRACLRDVLGEQVAPEPALDRPWRPHLTIAYGRQQVDTESLGSRLGYAPRDLTRDPLLARLPVRLISPVLFTADRVVLTDQDTWSPDGLTYALLAQIPLGGIRHVPPRRMLPRLPVGRPPWSTTLPDPATAREQVAVWAANPDGPPIHTDTARALTGIAGHAELAANLSTDFWRFGIISPALLDACELNILRSQRQSADDASDGSGEDTSTTVVTAMWRALYAYVLAALHSNNGPSL